MRPCEVTEGLALTHGLVFFFFLCVWVLRQDLSMGVAQALCTPTSPPCPRPVSQEVCVDGLFD